MRQADSPYRSELAPLHPGVRHRISHSFETDISRRLNYPTNIIQLTGILETSFIRYDYHIYATQLTGPPFKPRTRVHMPAWNRFNIPNGDRGQGHREHSMGTALDRDRVGERIFRPPSFPSDTWLSATSILPNRQLKSLPLRQQPLSQSLISQAST